MKRITIILLFLFLGLSFAFAQERNITGTVTSATDGSTIPGVQVVVKGTTTGTTTDLDGKYNLTVSASATILQFSFIGMKTTEVEIGDLTVINLTMEEDLLLLDEVIVVAYGTKTKRAVTGSVAVVDSEIIENQSNVSPIRAIQGVAAGVNVITTGGQPGENPTIRIRGIGSINAEAGPLIVVDGIVFTGNINSLSSDQIQSMNILKDASSSALYGSRAANGVILIVTKGGKYGKRKPKITVNVKGGYGSAAVKPHNLVNAGDYMQYAWEGIKNRKIFDDELSDADAASFATNNLITEVGYNPYGIDNPIGIDGQPVSGATLLWDTDWYDELIRNAALNNEFTVSAEGATDDVTYFVSANHLSQEGSVIESDFNRTSLRVNLQAKLTDWLEFGSNNSFSKSTQNYPVQSGNNYANTMQWVNTIASIFPVYQRDASGNLVRDNAEDLLYDFGNTSGQLVNASRLLSGGNALFTAKFAEILNTRTNLFSSSFIKANIYKELTFTSTFGYERYLLDQFEYDHYEYGSAASVNGRVVREKNLTETTTLINALGYRKSINDHTFGINVISEIMDLQYDRLGAQGIGFLPDVKVLSGSTTPEDVTGYLNQERLVGYLGRIDYSFKSKYYLDLSYRRDASTKFKSGNRWGNFYSVGGSWIVSDENFIKNLSEEISLIKLRISYGELGNNRDGEDRDIGYFPYFASFDIDWNNNDNTGVLKGGIVDEYISWEKTAMFNVALDFGFFNDRISGTIEYFNKESVDLLMEKPLAPSLGSTSVLTNIGDLRNKGIEFFVRTINIHTKDILWRTSFNIAIDKTEFTRLPQEEIIDGTKKFRVGRSMYDFFIQEYAGVDSETGEALWYMDQGDIVYDDDGEVMYDDDGKIMYDNYEKVTTNDYANADKYYVGSALPDFHGGFTSYFMYKNFDINVVFNFSFGEKVLDYSYSGLMGSVERFGQQLSADIVNRWQQPGDITDVPKLYAANNDYNASSTRFLFNNDYIRLKALNVGYNLPSSILNKINISSCRIYLQADNIWTYQSHKGIDPEQNLAGTTNSRSFIMKTVSFGINVGL